MLQNIIYEIYLKNCPSTPSWCGERCGAIWLPSHYPGGCSTLVVVEEIPPFYVKRFEYPEKRYINVLITVYIYIYIYTYICIYIPIAAHIKFKALMFAKKTSTGSAPLYLNSLLQMYVPSRSLRSASERCVIVSFKRGTKSLSQTFTLNVPSWWNELPNTIPAAESLAIFNN